MRKWWMLFVIAAICVSAYSQPRQRQLFTPVLTANGEFVNIPGTRVVIGPPEGFRVATKFTGLQKGNAVIEVYDLVGGAFEVISNDFTEVKLKQHAAVVEQVDDVRIDSYEGIFSVLRHEAGAKGMTLVFGDKSFSVIAIASFPEGDIALENAIRTSLLNIRYGVKDALDGRKTVPFILDDSQSVFHYARTSANTLYYYKDDRSADAYLTASKLAWDYSTNEKTIAELLLNQMLKHGVEKPEVKRSAMKKINGFRALESEVVARQKGVPCRIYQMIVLHGDHAIVIHGITTGSSGTLAELRRLAHTLKLR